MQSTRAKIISALALTIPILLTSACGAANETWQLVKLVAVPGEQIELIPEVIEVRNCDAVEQKTVSCSAGTSNNLNVSLGGGAGLGSGSVFEGAIDANVSSSLGLGRDAGESLDLEPPPKGFIYKYAITKEYRVLSGEVLAHSSKGNERTNNYVFCASCSLRIESRYTLNCNDGQVVDQPQAQPLLSESLSPFLQVIPQGLDCYYHNSGYCGLDMMIEWRNVPPNSGTIYTIGHAPYYDRPLWWVAGAGVAPDSSEGTFINDIGAYGNPGDSLVVFACLSRIEYTWGTEFTSRPQCDAYSEDVSIQTK
jgi:hypothetical protein